MDARRKAYQTAYESTPEQKANRAARGRARYWMMKRLGERALQGMDIDHKKPLAHGGSNDMSNLRLRPVHQNRGADRVAHDL